MPAAFAFLAGGFSDDGARGGGVAVGVGVDFELRDVEQFAQGFGVGFAVGEERAGAVEDGLGVEGFADFLGLPGFFQMGENLHAEEEEAFPRGLFGRGTQNLVLRNDLSLALKSLDREMQAVGSPSASFASMHYAREASEGTSIHPWIDCGGI